MNGHMRLSRSLTLPEYQYLMAFGETRRMQRDAAAEVRQEDRLREAVGLPIGSQGAFVVHGEESRSLVTNYNSPPAGQPGLWCPLRPSQDGLELVMAENGDRDESYMMGPWLKYLAESILKPWGITLEGRLWYQDEEGAGVILAKDGEVRDIGAVLAYTDPFTQETVFLRDEDE